MAKGYSAGQTRELQDWCYRGGTTHRCRWRWVEFYKIWTWICMDCKLKASHIPYILCLRYWKVRTIICESCKELIFWLERKGQHWVPVNTILWHIVLYSVSSVKARTVLVKDKWRGSTNQKVKDYCSHCWWFKQCLYNNSWMKEDKSEHVLTFTIYPVP